MSTIESVEDLRERALLYRQLPAPQMASAIRRAANISRDDLGAAIGVTGECIRLWETGRSRPRPDLAIRYLEALRALGGAA